MENSFKKGFSMVVQKLAKFLIENLNESEPLDCRVRHTSVNEGETIISVDDGETIISVNTGKKEFLGSIEFPVYVDVFFLNGGSHLITQALEKDFSKGIVRDSLFTKYANTLRRSEIISELIKELEDAYLHGEVIESDYIDFKEQLIVNLQKNFKTVVSYERKIRQVFEKYKGLSNSNVQFKVQSKNNITMLKNYLKDTVSKM